MQTEESQKSITGERLRIPTKPPAARGMLARTNSRRSIGRGPSGNCDGYLVRFYQDPYGLPCNQRVIRQQASKEILKRALSPPRRQLSWRWRWFQPTPSRLSNMSMA
ncbi:hypothetical protein Ancab_025342 [Ancistrocladus abbreviatus]